MLSSTMRTLIGGTAPSRRPRGNDALGSFPLSRGFLVALGRGDEARGGGAMGGSGPMSSAGTGGDGSGGGAGAPLIWI